MNLKKRIKNEFNDHASRAIKNAGYVNKGPKINCRKKSIGLCFVKASKTVL